MFLGRTLAFAACLLSLSVISSAETGSKSDASSKVEVGVGLGAGSGKADVKAEVKADPNKDQAKVEEPKASTGATKDASGVRRDPKGKKGISPFWEAIRRGDEAALARDFPKAQAAYQAAIELDPKNPLAHFRKGQALVRAGNLAEAETVYQDAMRLADKDTTIHAAALFVLADLKERQGQRDAAITAWKAYADYLKTESTAKGYPDTPADRDKRLKRYNELVVEGKAVRERIQLRVKELDEANKRKAAKNPNEGK
jgi:tetratricopeptide (TPR) repeat protein